MSQSPVVGNVARALIPILSPDHSRRAGLSAEAPDDQTSQGASQGTNEGASPKASPAIGRTPRRSVVLATAGAGGTLAATRDLAACGFEVSVLRSEFMAAAAWSKAAARSHAMPSEKHGDAFVERLLAIGAARPGQILLPTSDETAWMYTVNAERLQPFFRLYQPSIETLRRILDKQLLAAAAAQADVAALPNWELPNWEPGNVSDLVALATRLPYPILIKPRTHVQRLRTDKGCVAHTPAELIERYQRVVAREHGTSAGRSVGALVPLPLLQPFVDVTRAGVISVTGFIDRSGELFVTRCATKVFQRSQPAGVGVCFEALPANPALSDAVRRLCRELDYFGIFEVEFIPYDGTWAVIDFNPRLFNQIGMDTYRGMPLPVFACLDALGDGAALRAAVAQAQEADQDAPMVIYDRFTLAAIMMAKRLTAHAACPEPAYWRRWAVVHRSHAIDLAIQRGDPVPGAVHALSEVALGVMAIPKFLRSSPRPSGDGVASGTSVQPDAARLQKERA